MITMDGVNIHGRNVWDQSFFPRDECEARLTAAQAEMVKQGFAGFVVAGNFAQHEAFAYLTTVVPQLGAMCVVPARGEIAYITMGGGRELPALRARTWAEVKSLKNLNSDLDALLQERRIDGKIGLVGMDALPAGRYDELLAGLAGRDFQDADGVMAALQRSLRPRETAAIERAAKIAQSAAERAMAAHAGGASNAAAAIEAEGEARRLGALDCRCLANLDASNSLMPIQDATSFRTDSMALYASVSFLGYFAEIGTTFGAQPAAAGQAGRALQAMVESIRAGVRASDVARSARAVLDDESFAEAQAYGLGNGLGLSPHRSPAIQLENDEPLAKDSVLALRIRVGYRRDPGALASAIVAVTSGPARRLL